MEHKKEKIVYHYTPVEAFLKILEGVKNDYLILHASDIFSMNDPTEFKIGFSKIWELLPEIEDMKKIPSSLRLSNQWGATANSSGDINHVIDELHESFSSPFVISFSACEDFLPMWSTYGNKGNGLSIGFDITKHMDVIASYGTKVYLFRSNEKRAIKVSYEKISMNNPIVNYIESLYGNYLFYAKNTKNINTLSNIQKQFCMNIISYASALIKHPAYSYENEYRITRRTEISNVKIKTNSKGQAVAYIEVEIPIEDLKHIIIGPCCDYDSTKLILKTKMKQLGMDKVKISKSEVPYR